MNYQKEYMEIMAAVMGQRKAFVSNSVNSG